jgi:hypothetical protein
MSATKISLQISINIFKNDVLNFFDVNDVSVIQVIFREMRKRGYYTADGCSHIACGTVYKKVLSILFDPAEVAETGWMTMGHVEIMI